MMDNDGSRKRKATQTANTLSKKHKINTPTTSRVNLDTPTRPATRSISKIQPASPAGVHSPHHRYSSPQSTTDTHLTRFKTGSLKPKKPFHSPSPPSTGGGLSRWAPEMQREKFRHTSNNQSSPSTSSHTKKRSRAPPKPPPKPEEIIVISSDDGENPRPRKRLRRRHTTQVSEIIDLTKDEIPPPPRSRPTRLRPAPLPAPTPVASLRTSTSSSSPSKYIDLRCLSSSKSKSKPKTTPLHSKSHSQTQICPLSLKTKLPAASSPVKRRLNDDEERGSFASRLPAVEVVINKRNASQTRAKLKIPKTEPDPEPRLELEYNSSSTQVEVVAARPVFVGSKGDFFQKGRIFLSKEIRARLQNEEEEEGEENITSPPVPLNSTITNSTTNISGDANIYTSPAQVVIKSEDIEDTYVDRQSSISSLMDGEDLVVVKEEPHRDESSSIACLMSPLIHEQEQNDMEEAIFQSMLVASAMETGVHLADQKGEAEEQDGFSTTPTVSLPVEDVTAVRDSAQLETQVVFEEMAEKGDEVDHEGPVKAKDSEVEKIPDEVVPERPLCPPTTDITPYLDYELEQQEQADSEEALFQSQPAIVFSPPVSCWEDEDKQEQVRNQVEDPVEVTAPPTSDPTDQVNLIEEDVFVTEDLDNAALTTDEAATLPPPVITTSIGDQITHQALSNDITKTKDDEETRASLTESSDPLHQVAAPCPFSCFIPTTTFARFVPTESTSSVFIAGQLTQRLFAQSCLPPKVKTGPVQPVEEERKLEVQMAELVEETQEKMLTEVMMQSEEVPVQGVVDEVLIQSEEMQSLVSEVSVEMQMPAVLDVDVLDVRESEVQVVTAEQQAEAECEEGNEDEVEEGAVFIQPSEDDDDDLEIDVSSERDSEALASAAREASADADIGVGVICEVQDVLMIPAVAVHDKTVLDDTVLLQASGDEVVTGVAQEAEDEITQVETASVVSSQTTEDIDMVNLTLQHEFKPPSDETTVKVKTMTTGALEKDSVLSRALRGSRMLLEIIQGVINKTELEPEVGVSAVQVEEADGGIAHSPHFQTSTPEPEALPKLGDHDAPFLLDDESYSSKISTSEPLVQLEDRDDNTSRWSTDVSPSSLQVSEELTSEPRAEAKNSGDAPCYHVVLSARAQTSTPEPSARETEDVNLASSGLFEFTRSPRSRVSIPVFLEQSEGASVAHNRPLKTSSSPSLQKVTPETPAEVEDNVTAGTSEHESKDELPLTLTSIYNSSCPSHRHLSVEDGGQPCVQSTVSIGNIPSTAVSQRRTMSKTGSASSLATSDDSPPPSTPPQSAFEAYYIRSTSPYDGSDLDIFSKLTDIPSLPLPESDEDDDEYLLSLDFSYPDFDTVG